MNHRSIQGSVRRLRPAAFAVLIFAAGCSSEVDRSIEKLGGTEQEQEEAKAALSISAENPVPKLQKALESEELSETAKANAARLLAGKASEENQEEVVETLAKTLQTGEGSVKTAALESLETLSGPEAIEAIRTAMKDGKGETAEKARAILDRKSAEKVKAAAALSGESAIPRKIELLKEARDLAPWNAALNENLAGHYAAAKDVKKARNIMNAGGEYVTAYKVAGPFPMDAGDVLSPESFDPAVPLTGPSGTQRPWFDFKDADYRGIADFRKDPRTKVSKSMYYATFAAVADKSRPAVLRLYVRDKVKVWANGAPVKLEKTGKGAEAEARIDLKAGKNRLALKLGSPKYSRFSVRLSTPEGAPLKGVRYEM